MSSTLYGDPCAGHRSGVGMTREAQPAACGDGVRRRCRLPMGAVVALVLSVIVSPAIGTSGASSAAVSPPDVPAGLAAGANHSLVLKSDGTVWAFGSNGSGELGINAGPDPTNPQPTKILGVSGVTAVAAGPNHSLVLESDGTVWAFGSNEYGKLGLGDTFGHLGPTQVSGISGATAIAAGGGHSLVLKGDGTVWAFGFNGVGQLGTPTNSGSFAANPIPVQVPGITGANAIAAGAGYSLVLKADGTVWAFGSNYYGELGTSTNNGITTANPTPTQVPGIANATAVVASVGYSLVLKGDGTVWAFGHNGSGQLGTPENNNTSDPNPTPRPVPGISGATAIAAGGDNTRGQAHTLVAEADGSVWGFGANWFGELGTAANIGTGVVNPTPTVIAGLVGAASRNGAQFVSVIPGRLLESRSGVTPTIDGQSSGIGLREGGSVTVVQVAGRHGIPTNASAAILNVTVTEPGSSGYVTVWPCGTARPNASTLNYVAGQTVANSATVKINETGKVCIYTYAAAHLVVDVNGYYKVNSAFNAVVPGRVLESRIGVSPTVDGQSSGIGLRAAGSVTELLITGRAGVHGGTAVVLNVTVTEPGSSGYVTVWPCGTARPNASTLNYVAGQTVANSATVKINETGKVCIYTYAAAHLVVDVNGFYSSGAAFASVGPGRVLESRSGVTPTVDGQSSGIGLRAAGSVTELQIAGRDAVPSDASSAVLNVTVTDSRSSGYVTVWPCGTTRPNASTLNYVAGQTVANSATVKIGDDGKVCIYAYAATHVVVDINGYHG
jgi:hypothetical protein